MKGIAFVVTDLKDNTSYCQARLPALGFFFVKRKTYQLIYYLRSILIEIQIVKAVILTNCLRATRSSFQRRNMSPKHP